MPGSIILGQYGRHLLRDCGDTPVAIVGKNRSGKGVSCIVPTLLTNQNSVVVLDPKGELWDLTAGYRAQWSYVARWDPRRKTSVHLNPLLEIRKGDHEVADAQALITVLTDPGGDASAGRGEDHIHWLGTARGLLLATTLHVLYAAPPREKTIAGLLRTIQPSDKTLAAAWSAMACTCHLGTHPHPVVARHMGAMLRRPAREYQSIFSTCERMLAPWIDPLLDRAMSTSDFRLADLQQADKPFSLYLCVNGDDLVGRLQGVVRLLWQLIFSSIMQRPVSAYRYQVDLILDEFAAMQTMRTIEARFPLIPGYGVRPVIVLQSLHQIDQWYGRDSSLLSQCETKVVFPPGDERDAERVVTWLGDTTHDEPTMSTTQERLGWGWGRITRGTRRERRPLLSVDQVMGLRPGRPGQPGEVLIVAGQTKIRAQQLQWYGDTRFRECVQAPPVPSVRHVPPQQVSPWLTQGRKPIRPLPSRRRAHGGTYV